MFSSRKTKILQPESKGGERAGGREFISSMHVIEERKRERERPTSYPKPLLKDNNSLSPKLGENGGKSCKLT